MADEVFSSMNLKEWSLTLNCLGLFEVISMIQMGWLSSTTITNTESIDVFKTFIHGCRLGRHLGLGLFFGLVAICAQFWRAHPACCWLSPHEAGQHGNHCAQRRCCTSSFGRGVRAQSAFGQCEGFVGFTKLAHRLHRRALHPVFAGQRQPAVFV